jgi:hypothetical protein
LISSCLEKNLKMNNSHDEIKKLLNASRKMLSTKESVQESFEIKKKYGLILEDESDSVFRKINVAKSIEKEIDDDEETETSETSKRDKSVSFRISGGILTLNGKEKSDLTLTNMEKEAFQETMDEFVTEVSDMVKFNPLNVYSDNVEWSGLLKKFNLEFRYNLFDGVYIEGGMIKVDDEMRELITRLEGYFKKFES